ncbi:SAM-dependent methyltransferase [Sphaerisporangium sp. B11E5]|uniref:SAM-dependent methyltransferase n=1 Tax=Sphaerisporangium sp. B11E5 TaxID=3153563 RepID=UPI00325D60F6
MPSSTGTSPSPCCSSRFSTTSTTTRTRQAPRPASASSSPPGSYQAISHIHNPGAAHPEVAIEVLASEKICDEKLGTGRWRTRDEILAYFGDLDLLVPGLVPWPSVAPTRPISSTSTPRTTPIVGSLARKSLPPTCRRGSVFHRVRELLRRGRSSRSTTRPSSTVPSICRAKALRGQPPAHPAQAVYLSELGTALLTRYDRSGAEADLDEAVATLRLAASTVTHRSHWLEYAGNVGTVLRTRFERRGYLADLNEAVHTATGPEPEEAVTLAQAAAGASPTGRPDPARILDDLAATPWLRFARSGNHDDLTGALTASRDSVAATPDGHPVLAVRPFQWELSLRTRFEQTGAGAPDSRLRAARAAGGLNAHLADDWPCAADAYRQAVALVPLVAWHGLIHPDQERRLAHHDTLVRDAAAHPPLAVELLEQGGAVLRSHQLDLRSDLTLLHESAPTLAPPAPLTRP